jgi:hypothetical protein
MGGFLFTQLEGDEARIMRWRCRVGKVPPGVPGATQHFLVVRRRPGTVSATKSGTVPALRCTADALHRVRDTYGETAHSKRSWKNPAVHQQVLPGDETGV